MGQWELLYTKSKQCLKLFSSTENEHDFVVNELKLNDFFPTITYGIPGEVKCKY